MDHQITRWFNPRELRQFLKFKGNVVGGAQLRDHIHHKVGGRFYAGPSDAQDCLCAMVKLNILRPSKFSPVVNGTIHALNLTYSSRYINTVLPASLVRGTEDSWCYRVVNIPRWPRGTCIHRGVK